MTAIVDRTTGTVRQVPATGFELRLELMVPADVVDGGNPDAVRRFETQHFGGGGGLVLSTSTGTVLGTAIVIDARSRPISSRH